MYLGHVPIILNYSGARIQILTLAMTTSILHLFQCEDLNRLCVCVCVCVCGHVYVVYEDTNLYNDMV